MNRANAPGKSHRKGVSLKAIMRRFPSNEKAAEWFIKQRWPSGVCCPYCGSLNVQVGCQHKTMPFRCREKACGRKRFSVRTGTVMECSKIGYQDWMLAMFLVMTNLKGVSSMQLHRDLEINQRSAWFLAHRLRLALSERVGPFSGPVEADETYMGGKRRNMSNAQRKQLEGTGRGRSREDRGGGREGSRDQQGGGQGGGIDRQGDAARVRERPCRVRCDRLYG